jgi:Mg2+-importing ATPase
MAVVSGMKTHPSSAPEVFWHSDAAELLRSLDTRPEGLRTAEATQRLLRYGPNAAVVRLRRSLAVKLVRRLTEPLVAILLIAGAISGATGDWQSFVVIAVIVLLSIGLDLVQEHKAEAAVEALRRSVGTATAVRRDGRAIERPVGDVVPGDVV